MALLRWGEEEEKDKEPGITTIQSVQDSWQPTDNNAAVTGQSQGIFDQTDSRPNNYLMSDQKAQFDQQQRAQREAEAQARAAAEAQARAAAAVNAEDARRRAASDAQAKQARQQQYMPVKKKPTLAEATGDFFQGIGKGLWKGAAGAIGSGASLVSSLIGGSAENDVTRETRKWQQSADKWGEKVNANGVGEFLGNLPGGIVGGFVDPASYLARGVRQTPEMLAATIDASSSDPKTRKMAIERQRQLQENLFTKEVSDNGDLAMLMEGVSRPAEVALNILTAGGAGSLKTTALDSLGNVFKPVAKQALLDAGINTVSDVPLSIMQQAARGQEITPESIARDIAIQGTLGAALGGSSKYRGLKKQAKGLKADLFTPVGGRSPLSTAMDVQTRISNFTPDRLTEGGDNFVYKNPNSPDLPTRPQPDTPTTHPDAPTNTPTHTPVRQMPTTQGVSVYDATPRADGVSSRVPEPASATEIPTRELTLAEKTVDMADEMTPRPQIEENPNVAKSADGISADPARVVGDEGANIRTEPIDVRELQDSRAGKTQAEEAAINQQLQEIEGATPRIRRLYRGLQEPFDPNYDMSRTDAPTGYSTFTDSPELARRYAGDDGHVYQYDIPEEALAKAPGEIMPVQKTTPKAPSEPAKTSDLPGGMEGGDTPTATTTKKADLLPAEPMNKAALKSGYTPLSGKEFAKRSMSTDAKPDGIKARLARAFGLEKDVDSDIGAILESADKVSAKDKVTIQKHYERLEELTKKKNKIQEGFRKDAEKGTVRSQEYIDGKAKERNSMQREKSRIERELDGYARKYENKGNVGGTVANIAEQATTMKNTNQLLSAGGVERNAVQDLASTIGQMIGSPIKSLRAMKHGGSTIKASLKSVGDKWAVKPKTFSEALPWLVRNMYETSMVGATVAQKGRMPALRAEIARFQLEASGRKATPESIRAQVAKIGDEGEALANMWSGVSNHMISKRQARKAQGAYEQFFKTGNKADHTKFMDTIDRTGSLAQKLQQLVGKSDNPAGRVGLSIVNALMPYMTVVKNAGVNAAYRAFDFTSQSTLNEITRSVRSNPSNVLSTLKHKALDLGILGGVAALTQAGVIGYNERDDDQSKPQGVYIDMGDGKFWSPRGTPIETELAAVVAVVTAANDIAEGKDVGEVAKRTADMIINVTPYLSNVEGITDPVNSLLGNSNNGEGDGGYAAKSFAVNQAKGYVPLAYNNLQAWHNRNMGESTNSKKVYDKDGFKWLGNSVRASFDPAFRDSLEDSRDASGRTRTVDSSGALINKTVNDSGTKEFNDRITDLVKYGRDNQLGKGTQDLFNSFPDGKNDNFRSVHQTISFLDTNGGNPKNENKLKKNAKLTDLSQQIRNGYFGDTGSELLTLDGEHLKSDVSVPGKYGGKSSKLPLSMESIKNAIGQTDLPEAERDRLYEIGQQKDGLFERRKAGEISYDQEQAMRRDIAAQEQEILQNSESYKKLDGLMRKLDSDGFFNEGGLGSTKAGQTYLWNVLNSMLGEKGSTPAAQYPKNDSYGSGGRGRRRGGGNLPNSGQRGKGIEGLKWTPVGKRQMASVKTSKYTPAKATVKLSSAIKKDKSQNYESRTI